MTATPETQLTQEAAIASLGRYGYGWVGLRRRGRQRAAWAVRGGGA